MKCRRLAILGGGMSGLTLAWFLKRRFGERIDLILLEKNAWPGGWTRTIHHDGFLFEKGPRGCRPKGSGIETLKLIEQLHLENEVIVADRASCRRYIWIHRKLRSFPTGVFSFFTSPLARGMIPALIRDLRTLPTEKEDESIYQFISRRFSRDIAEKLVDPLVLGIFAGDIRKLSIRSCFPLLHLWEQAYGSVLKGFLARKKSSASSPFIRNVQKHPLFSLKKGMQSLVNELAKRLHNDLHLSSEVQALRCRKKAVDIALSNGSVLEADHVFSTIPAYALASIVPSHEPRLTEIPWASLAVVNLGYHRSLLLKKGFGYLIPSSEKEQVLGVVWDSSIFPQQNHIPEETRLTVMIGGRHMQHVDTCHEQELVAIARSAVSDHLGIENAPDAISVTVSQSAIPQYLVGHAQRIRELEMAFAHLFPRITLSGNSFQGVSVNDCVANSKYLEEKVHAILK